MSYRLMVSDLDGTMFEGDLKTCAQNTASIRRMLDTGRYFAIATGRPAYSALAVARKLGLCVPNQYVICFQGGIIAEAATGRELFSINLDRGDALHIIKNSRDRGATVIAYIGGLPYTHYHDKEAAEYANQVGVSITVNERFEDITPGEFNKVVMRGAPECLKKIEASLSDWARDRVSCVYSSFNLLEYFSPEASKGAAMLMLAEKLGVGQEETIAIGDYFNDLSMIEMAGLGVAVKDSPPEICAAASYVTEKTAKEGAVSEVIERFVFGLEK